MTKSYSILRAQMAPEARALAEKKVQAMIAGIEQSKSNEQPPAPLDNMMPLLATVGQVQVNKNVFAVASDKIGL